MKKTLITLIGLTLFVGMIPLAFAAEHGGKEHGGTATTQQQGQASMKVPSADAVRTAMKNYVTEKSKASQTFDIQDPQTGTPRKLKLERIHQRVGKTGSYYYSCADFKDTVSGEMLDLDLDVQDNAGVLSVVDVRIHKVSGKERYTYDENDNRIPVSGSKEHEHEHGGKEHGGK